jgi:hypothetical protein
MSATIAPDREIAIIGERAADGMGGIKLAGTVD